MATTSADRMRTKRIRDADKDFIEWYANDETSLIIQDFIDCKKLEFEDDNIVIIFSFLPDFVTHFRNILEDLSEPQWRDKKNVDGYLISDMQKAWNKAKTTFSETL